MPDLLTRKKTNVDTMVTDNNDDKEPVPTKGFLQQSPEAAMLPGPSVETRPPPSVLPFLLAQNLSPKDTGGSDITS